MTTALISPGGEHGGPTLAGDLEAVGIDVLAESETASLLQDVIRLAPDLIIWSEAQTGDDFFDATAAIQASSPRPVIVFTNDPDALKIDRAAGSGVHCYVIAGYSRQRLRSVVRVAQARFRHQQSLTDELGDVNRKFEERKLVDRAKGILMGARQIREEEAFRILRTQAMRQKRRIGQVAQGVIAAARYAEAVNLSGQLRMLSQRIVKYYGLACARGAGGDAPGLLDDTRKVVTSNLQVLSRSISLATFGDLFEGVAEAWKELEGALGREPVVAQLHAVDGLGERLLLHAEKLTSNLEIAGLGAALHIINVSGRQRMLSQRLAKLAILATLLEPPAASAAAASLAATLVEFTEALAYLKSIPLSTEAIRQELAGAEASWGRLRAAVGARPAHADLPSIAAASEEVLGHFETLTEHYERSLQVLLD